MTISGMSDINSTIIQQASGMKSAEVQQKIEAAVLKQTLDQQQMEGEALVKMIQASPSAEGTGQLVDILA